MPSSLRFSWKRLVCLIAFGIGLSLPLSASAEPIQWSVKSTVLADNGASWVDVGPVTTAVGSPGGDIYNPTHAYGRTPGGTGEQSFEGSQLGSNAFRVASMGNREFLFTSTPPVPVAPNFRLRLEVTDLASNEQGVLEFVGGHVIVGVYENVPGIGEVLWIDRPVEVDLTLQESGVRTLELGGNRYSFDVRGGHSESLAFIEAEVTVSPLVQTPEPSTLALAGLGFSTFAFRKRRRQELV